MKKPTKTPAVPRFTLGGMSLKQAPDVKDFQDFQDFQQFNGDFAAPDAVLSAIPLPSAVVTPAPRLLDQMRAAVRVRHYSIRTEDTYVDWARRFILFHNKRHPRDMGGAEVTAFLTHLAVERNVAPSTQNQAKSALPHRCRAAIRRASLAARRPARRSSPR